MSGMRRIGVGNVVLALLLVGALAAGTVGWLRTVELGSAVRRLELERDGLTQRLRDTESRARQTRAYEDEIARLRKDTEELHRLRGQYREWQQLKTEHERLQQQNQQLTQAQQSAAQALRAATSAPQAAPTAPAPTSWIGIAMEAGPGVGVLVQSVVPGGPAANTGLANGDVVVAVDGQAVSSPEQLRQLVGSRPVGQPVTLDVQREGNPFRVRVVTSAFPR
jgi:C-terminal processing protease CtpA/Prc